MKHSRKLLTMTLLGAVAIASFALIKYQKTNNEIIAHSDFLENFEANSELTIRYAINNQNIPVKINRQLNTQGYLKLTENFLLNKASNYKLSYELQSNDNDQTSFTVDVSQNNIKSRLKGLPLKSSIFVTLDKEIIEQKVPVDWNGSVSFNHSLDRSTNPIRLCFIVTHNEISTLCHTIPAEKGQLS